MKPKTMILMGLAITCGLGASWMTSKLLAGRQPEEAETVNILVAKANVNVGELLKKPEEYFVFKQVNVKEVPEGAIREPDAVKEKIMKRSLRKGDHITANEMYGTSEQLDIPEGFVAVGMKVNIETAASGFASLPRSRVDVLMTCKVNNNDINQSFVQVLLEDVLVLAADTDTTREKGLVVQAAVVTLALQPDDAKRITGGRVMGELSLALRKPGDHSRTDRPVMTFAEIKASRVKEVAKSVEPEAPPVLAPKLGGDNVKAVEKPQEPTAPLVVEPKTTKATLTIANGPTSRKTHFRYTEDGKLVEDDGEAEPQPAPAANRPEAVPTENRPQAVPSRVKKNSGPMDY